MKEDSISQNNFSTHSIANFKAFKDLHGIEIAPITLIYGQNSGGKSTFIQSILALSQSCDSIPKSEIKFSGNNINVGTFETIQNKSVMVVRGKRPKTFGHLQNQCHP